MSFDFNDNDPNPSPNLVDDFHGTAVAGIIAGVGDNGIGVAGTAFDATLAALRLIGYDPNAATFTDEKAYQALTYAFDQIDIYNNSWGFENQRAVTELGPFQTQALIDSVFLGRDGLGNIQVVASGNESALGDRADHDPFANSIYTIAVSAFGPRGTGAAYAEGGASVFVMAPSGTNPPNTGIITTDYIGSDGYNNGTTVDDLADPNYTSSFNGTSAAAPAASGIIGLMVAAARDNGIELTYRDVKHILALSARRIDAGSGGWRTDARPLFFDPRTDAGVPYGAAVGMGPGVTAIPWTIDETGATVTDTVAQYANATNSAGFFVHDTTGTGYGHGAIDAGAAVKLASTWQSVGVQTSTRVLNASLPSGLIPAAETIDPNIVIPGGFGGFGGRDFQDFFELWLNPPDEVPDPLPTNGRGGAIELAVPANYTIEDIEVRLEMTLDPEASDKLRMTLISPDGTHSELTNWIQDGGIGPLTDTGILSHTFTTERHWGERSDGVGRIDPLTGERIEPNVQLGANGEVTHGIWQLVFENWSGEEAILNGGSSVSFHGVPTPVVSNFGNDLGGRIQGSIGLDINQDGLFNVTGIVATELPPIETEVNGIAASEIVIDSGMDASYEPMVAGVMVYVDINKNGVRDATEPHKRTGADGNYYFDLPWNQPGTTYDVRFELPSGYVNLGPEMHQYSIGLQDDDSIIATHGDGHFLFEPEAIAFEGNVFADFDLDAIQDPGDTTVSGFRVFVDLNENGKLDYQDLNANNVFDNGTDMSLEPMAITSSDGSFSIEVNTDWNLPTDFFGNSLFLNDRFLGTEYYTLMLDAREGWAPTGIDVSEPGFANVLLNNGDTPGYAFHRMYVEAGETVVDMDFSVAPDPDLDLGSISGFVFNDVNQNGTKQSNEGGLAGFIVYLDTDNSIQAAIQGGADPTQTATFDTAEASIITGANGAYLFENLPSGSYDIYITLAPGFDADDQTHPNANPPGTIGFHLNRSLAAGQSLGNGLVNFGFFDPAAPTGAPRDYGDLDAPFLTTSVVGGPSHGIVEGFHLGATVAAEPDGDPGGDHPDDDGVTILDEILAGSLVRVDVEASTNVLFLQGWIDFNSNGMFDLEEHLAFRDASGSLLPFAQQPRLESGLNELSFIVPNDVMGSSIAARFRYGEGGHAQFNQPNGAAFVGEVEDYVIGATVSSSFIEPLAGDYNGNNVVDDADYQVWKQTRGSQIDFRADGNGDGKITLADYAVWRDNRGASAQAVQTVFAPLMASAATSEAAPATLDASLAFFAVDGSDETSPSLATRSSDAQPTAAIDLYFLYSEADEVGGGDESSFGAAAADSNEEALLVALEEDFGSAL